VSEKQEEKVLVVPTELFHELGHFQGFSEEVNHYRERLLDPQVVRFLPRGQVEEDPGYKQLIPYLLFCFVDQQRKTHIFHYVRGTGQGEGRLHRKRSVGVGGHISSTDVNEEKADPYREGLMREMQEEVVVNTPYTEQCVGLINDDQTEVGKVHLGIVHRFDVQKPEVTPRESEIIESGFVPVDRLLEDLDGFETWSSICLKSLFGQIH
jgi:predicted NUDIX family phosphoesterase